MNRHVKWGILLGAAGAVGIVLQTMRLRRAARTPQLVVRRDEQVTEASEDSFPASDPPSHTPTIGSSVSL